MSLLHIVNKSPFEHTALDSCLRLAKSGSSIIFIEDGIYAVREKTAAAEKVSATLSDFTVYALAPDVSARGLGQENMVEGVSLVDYDGFVKLTTEHDNVKTWL